MNLYRNPMIRVMNNAVSVGITDIAYNIKTLDATETEIEIYNTIRSKKSYDWARNKDGPEVTPSSFKEELDAVTTPNITIRMNCSGGEVASANVIAVAIQEVVAKGKVVKCKIDGVCASAAVQIATACSEIIMHKSALMMIHNPMAFVYGTLNAGALQRVINMLDANKESIINHYVDKTGLKREEISDMMDAETWMDGNKAVEKGFADRLMFDDEMKVEDVMNNIQNVCLNTALNLPEDYRNAINQINKPTNTQEGALEMEIKTVQDLIAQYPTLTNELRTQITNEISEGLREEGAKAERERLQAIDAMQGKVDNEALNKAKYETFATAEKVALDAITNGSFVQTGVINAMTGETAQANNVAGVVTPDGTPAVDEKKTATENASNIALDYLKSMGKVEQ